MKTAKIQSVLSVLYRGCPLLGGSAIGSSTVCMLFQYATYSIYMYLYPG